MTLREYFAGQALAGLCTSLTGGEIGDLADGMKGGRYTVGAARTLADALIAELEK